MFLSLIKLLFGFVVLIKGADVMINGSTSIAKKFGISSIVIGLTIVAFGTSAPELMVSSIASFKGTAGIALGNIIGSNISNTLLILGVAALITPLTVLRNTVNKEIPLSLLAVIAIGVLVNDSLIDGDSLNVLSRIDGMALIMFFVIFIYYTFGISKVKNDGLMKRAITAVKKEDFKEYSVLVSVIMILIGLIALAIGGQWIVGSAVVIASAFGLSEALIGLTIVAIGTSLPELAASAIAAKKGQSDMAIGNVVGSNIFNIFWVLGISAIIRPIGFDSILNADIIILFAITIMLLFLVYVGKRNVLARWEGVVLLMSYVAYIIFLVYRG